MGEASAELWREYGRTHSRDVRNVIAEGYIGLAKKVSFRFSYGKEDREDLEQVAYVGLLKAVENYDAARGAEFSTYAVHMMTGEIRHYFRDKTEQIHVNRGDRENLQKLLQVQEKLTYALQREPSIRECAEEMKISTEEALYLLEMRNSTETISLDSPPGEEDEGTIEDFLGQHDPNFSKIENREWMDWLMTVLTEQEKQLIHQRFILRKNQRDTAKVLGVSQMHVSRAEKRLLDKLKNTVSRDDYR